MRFSTYAEALLCCLGHVDQMTPFRFYYPALLVPGDRKSVESMAARTRSSLCGAGPHMAWRKTYDDALTAPRLAEGSHTHQSAYDTATLSLRSYALCNPSSLCYLPVSLHERKNA